MYLLCKQCYSNGLQSVNWSQLFSGQERRDSAESVKGMFGHLNEAEKHCDAIQKELNKSNLISIMYISICRLHYFLLEIRCAEKAVEQMELL